MSLKIPHIKFNAGAFGHTFVGRRATRWLKTQFDGLGEERVIFIVQNNRMILDLLPSKLKVHYRKLGEQYREMFSSFNDEEVYNWIPDEWREVIESVDGGKEWGLRQVVNLRKFALA
ncbi:hypothetical protein LCGC14_0607290 [marine sediment metagenome]|uniref:Uncharacterized protein n=1 Tax=marine sediment metagenome TaxID=412755 RepID=A0A0F9UH62_9ZZZZ